MHPNRIYLFYILTVISQSNIANSILQSPLPPPSPQMPPQQPYSSPPCGTELQTRILNQLLSLTNSPEQYNKDVRPPPGDNATLITANMAIRNILWVDEKIHQWNVDLFFRTEWEDPRLQYFQFLQSQGQLGCLNNLNFLVLTSPEAIGSIWKPLPCFFTTAIEGNVYETFNRNEVVRIYPNGHVWHSVHARVTLFCSGIGSRPGEVMCPLGINPYGSTKDKIVSRWAPQDPIQIDRTQILLSDHVVGDIELSVQDTVDPTGVYSTLFANFHFLRKTCLP